MSLLQEALELSPAASKKAVRRLAELPTGAGNGRLLSTPALLGLQTADEKLSRAPLTPAEKLLIRTQLVAHDLAKVSHPESRFDAYTSMMAPFVHAATKLPSRQQRYIFPALHEVIRIASSDAGTSLEMIESIAGGTHNEHISTPAMEAAHLATRHLAKHFPLKR